MGRVHFLLQRMWCCGVGARCTHFFSSYSSSHHISPPSQNHNQHPTLNLWSHPNFVCVARKENVERFALRQYRAHAGLRHGPQSQQRAPWYAHGNGADRTRPVEGHHEVKFPLKNCLRALEYLISLSTHFRFCPSSPDFANRDRFVLSNGHGCALLYSILHLTG